MQWFQQKWVISLPVGGRILRRKAEELIGIGLINRFKKRSGLVYKKVTGEANCVNQEELEVWKDVVLSHLMP
jgi:hypothetical protein